MATQKRRVDRRIQRTRQVSQPAFVDVLREKGHALTSLREIEKCFAATSIQEITERANVNRGTFYLLCWLRGSSVLAETIQIKKAVAHFEDELAARVCLSRWSSCK